MTIELASGVKALKEKDIKHLNDEWLDELLDLLINKTRTFLDDKYVRGLIGDIDKNEKSTLRESDEVLDSFRRKIKYDKELDDKLQSIPESNELSRLHNEIEGMTRYSRRR
jgi:hypothetical protein